MTNHTSNYSEPPRNWKDLQNKTARIFSELGYNTDVEKKIETVRGKVEVDVVAEQQIPIRLTIFCECKQWSKKVPQTVIHAFQTVVQNSGANIGYIISKKGFNAGAYKAAEKTNIKLVEWVEFLKIFEEEWLAAHSKQIRRDFGLLIDLGDYFGPDYIEEAVNKLRPDDAKLFRNIQKKTAGYGNFILVISLFKNPLMRELVRRNEGLYFPMRFGEKDEFLFNSAYELVDWMYNDAMKHQEEIRNLLNLKPRSG